jgi:glycosyltransferase involved in cell wall biosynthesis
MGAGEAELLFDAFARAADQRDEVDLVLLDRHDSALERVARAAGLEQRVHFVGRAPREAESAWLQNARVAFVTLAEPLSGGLVRRSLGLGCPLLAVGETAEPVADWLRGHGASWSRPGVGALAWDTVADALHRTPAVGAAIQRGRALAAQGAALEVAAGLRAALASVHSKRDRAA